MNGDVARRLPPSLALMVSALLAALGFVVALWSGSVSLSLDQVWQALFAQGSEPSVLIVQELRLPRAQAALVTGAMLAVAGALLQVLLRNPLADPYILGVSGGASLAVLIAMVLGVTALGLAPVAILGAGLSVVLVFALASGRGLHDGTRLLLTGVMVSAGWSAAISLVLALAPDQNLRGMLFWLMGDLSHARVVWPAWLVLALALLLIWPQARALNLLAQGDQAAAALGVDTRRLRLGVYLLAAMLAGAAVTLAGSVGFVGLVVPHLLRFLIGNDYRWLLPGSALLGAAVLVWADTLARSAVAPSQLPVGVVMALLGVPVFLWLLRREGR